nr:sulfatase-like hydrolase/transferase [uncultured Roseateles sp.]
MVRFKQGLRYALLATIGLVAVALSESVLQNTTTLYLAFHPGVFLHQGWFVLAFAASFGLAGAWLDCPGRATRLSPWVRMLLLLVLYIGLFQVFRRSLAVGVAVAGLWKIALVGLCFLAAWATARRAAEATQWRIASATSVSLLAMFALQPGMPSYLLERLSGFDPRPHDTASVTGEAPSKARRTVVVVLDEWDYEIALREDFFARPAMQAALKQSFSSSQAQPGGPNTLVSVPSMLRGQTFGPVRSGSPGVLTNARDESWQAGQSSLFSDLDAASVPYSIVGFYHDYCRVFPKARHCESEPVHFFPGWWSAATRAVRRSSEYDAAYSDFLRQWAGTYQHLREAALRTATASHSSFIWLHINIPHPPSAVMGARPHSLKEDYRSNLDLTEAFVAELLQRLDAQGPDYALVLTSDHWLREKEMWRDIYARQVGPGAGDDGKTDDQRVPFIVHFGKSAEPAVQGDQAISTIALRKLVPLLIQRRINSPQDVAAFFKRQGS